MARPPAPPTQSSPAYALTLFILGVMVSLLALLGRLSQEMEGRLLFDLSNALTRTTDDVEPALPALIDGLHTPGQRLVALGFAVGAAASLAGGVCGSARGVQFLIH